MGRATRTRRVSWLRGLPRCAGLGVLLPTWWLPRLLAGACCGCPGDHGWMMSVALSGSLFGGAIVAIGVRLCARSGILTKCWGCEGARAGSALSAPLVGVVASRCA